VSADRDAAVDQAVQAWVEDVAEGKRSQLLAWRRANVESLNQAAREAWRALGHLHGPELEAPGGRRYSAGDLVVTLAPGSDRRLVTSQQGQVIAVDRASESVTVRTDDGHTLHLAGEAIGADRLAHSYALTVHRAQGLTVERC
jgi:ATP-dependent exoDNAse (exonuclease V) alpha subunit